MTAWGIVPGLRLHRGSAESATQASHWPSVPHILLVELNAVSAQQLAVFLLKSAGAMVLFLRLYVLQHSVELARAHRKGRVPTLPEKAAIPSLKSFDPFRGRFLYLFDHLGLRKSSRQRRQEVNVIGNTAHEQGVASQVAADRRQISVHAGPYV
jgi:hypothetical protein